MNKNTISPGNTRDAKKPLDCVGGAIKCLCQSLKPSGCKQEIGWQQVIAFSGWRNSINPLSLPTRILKRRGRRENRAEDGKGKICQRLISGGCQSPRCASNSAATASTNSSSHGRATICTPIGKPSFDRPKGITAAAVPSRLNHSV